MQEMQVQSVGQEDSLKEEMATHSNILAWKIPWTEEPGGLWSMGSQSQTRLKRLSSSSSSCNTENVLNIRSASVAENIQNKIFIFKNFY